MASANLELVRSLRATWDRGDYSSAEWAHPEVVFVIADGPSPGQWTGPAGLVEGSRDILSVWEGFRGVTDDVFELDDERVLVLTRFTGRGKTSGVELGRLGAKGAQIIHIRDGKVTKVVIYFDRNRALTALGLAPDTDAPAS